MPAIESVHPWIETGYRATMPRLAVEQNQSLPDTDTAIRGCATRAGTEKASVMSIWFGSVPPVVS